MTASFEGAVMPNLEYQDYLSNRRWRELSRRVWRRDDGRCQFCFGRATEVHHLTYDHIFNEPDEDLVCICRDCHQRIHVEKWTEKRQRADLRMMRREWAA